MSSKNIAIAAVLVLILLVGGVFVLGQNSPQQSVVAPQVTDKEEVSEDEVMEREDADLEDVEDEDKMTVDYTDDGFVPKTITVEKGTTVTWTNKSSKGMWVASAVHPTHEVYPEFDQKESVESGKTYSFTFNKVGSWNYHNHVGPSDTGTVVVEEN